MRFIITSTKIEYINTKGKVRQLPNTERYINLVLKLANRYKLMPQHFNDRAIYTEYYA